MSKDSLVSSLQKLSTQVQPDRKTFRKTIRNLCSRLDLSYVNQGGSYYITDHKIAVSLNDENKVEFEEVDDIPDASSARKSSSSGGTRRKKRHTADYDFLGFTRPPLEPEELDLFGQEIYSLAAQHLKENGDGKLLWYAFSMSTLGRMFESPQKAFEAMIQKYTLSKGKKPNQFHVFQNHIIGIGPFEDLTPPEVEDEEE